jgi:L-ascorbate metabolism protein UlaG (beta-lactamase superfamily)
MIRILILLAVLPVWAFGQASASGPSRPDIFKTAQGDLSLTLQKHASLVMTWNGKVIYVDPVSSSADYAALPKADLILITHAHSDHFDPAAIAAIRTSSSRVILTAKAAEKEQGTVLANGESLSLLGLTVEAVPAYNLVHMRSPNVPYHPKGEGNGYVLTLGGFRVYIAGDTENIPEMRALRNIDVALLPMNLPYTMTPEMAADAARSFGPKVVYPYHYKGTDPRKLAEALKDEKGIEVRIREIY